ncbi:hypothetical protein B484DRAFT_471635, partial [Ochromonadaceae sp. CCMP2298]
MASFWTQIGVFVVKELGLGDQRAFWKFDPTGFSSNEISLRIKRRRDTVWRARKKLLQKNGAAALHADNSAIDLPEASPTPELPINVDAKLYGKCYDEATQFYCCSVCGYESSQTDFAKVTAAEIQGNIQPILSSRFESWKRLLSQTTYGRIFQLAVEEEIQDGFMKHGNGICSTCFKSLKSRRHKKLSQRELQEKKEAIADMEGYDEAEDEKDDSEAELDNSGGEGESTSDVEMEVDTSTTTQEDYTQHTSASSALSVAMSSTADTLSALNTQLSTEQDAVVTTILLNESSQIIAQCFAIDMQYASTQRLGKEHGAGYLNDELVNFSLELVYKRFRVLFGPDKADRIRYYNTHFMSTLENLSSPTSENPVYTYGNIARWSRRFKFFEAEK